MQKIILLLTLLIAVILYNTCSESTAPPPPPDDEPDTTSHDIFWQIDTVGSYGSIFRDVAVINDSLIWAVGEIYDDERTKYGAAIWNGREWSFKYFRLPTMSGGTITPQGIWAFSESNIWLVWGHIYNWNGQSFKQVHKITEPIGGINKIWASSENDIWFVGTKGLIIHYDGSSFTTMEKLTDIELTDIWGTGPDNIWACGYTQPNATVILHYNGANWEEFHYLPWNQYIEFNDDVISGPASSLWTNNPDSLWLVNYWGLYRVNTKNSKDFIRIPPVWHGASFRIRAHAPNDIMFCSDRSSIWHYNGASAQTYLQLAGRTVILGISILKNGFILVGTDYDSDKALVYWGRR